MIKIKKDRVKFKGSIPELCAEITVLCVNLRKTISEELSEEYAKDLILKAVNLGLKTEEEIKKELLDKLGELIEGEKHE